MRTLSLTVSSVILLADMVAVKGTRISAVSVHFKHSFGGPARVSSRAAQKATQTFSESSKSTGTCRVWTVHSTECSAFAGESAGPGSWQEACAGPRRGTALLGELSHGGVVLCSLAQWPWATCGHRALEVWLIQLEVCWEYTIRQLMKACVSLALFALTSR